MKLSGRFLNGFADPINLLLGVDEERERVTALGCIVAIQSATRLSDGEHRFEKKIKKIGDRPA